MMSSQVPDKIKKIIKEYIHQLEKHQFHIQQAYLFGSCLNALHDEWSDIDIALVSDSFEGIRFEDRKKISRITLSVSKDLSPLPYRPEDFTPDDPLVNEILKTGLRVV